MRATTRWRARSTTPALRSTTSPRSGTGSSTAARGSSSRSSIDAGVVAEIESLTELAPLHNGPGLAGIRAAPPKLPDLPQVACFDTAFHATMPDAARGTAGRTNGSTTACGGTASTG